MIIYLGDYIDRGPDSRGVLETLLGAPPIPSARRVFLCGNHEEALLTFLADPDAAPKWLEFGGMETLASYGVRRARRSGVWRQDLAEQMAEALPDSHRQFLEGLQDHHQVGPYFFVHAGVRPGVPLARQSSADCRWIREPFLQSRRWHGACIVHGHTITDQPVVRDNRLGIDTGAYAGGALTCAVLEGHSRSFLQIKVG